MWKRKEKHVWKVDNNKDRESDKHGQRDRQLTARVRPLALSDERTI